MRAGEEKTVEAGGGWCSRAFSVIKRLYLRIFFGGGVGGKSGEEIGRGRQRAK